MTTSVPIPMRSSLNLSVWDGRELTGLGYLVLIQQVRAFGGLTGDFAGVWRVDWRKKFVAALSQGRDASKGYYPSGSSALDGARTNLCAAVAER